MSTHHTTTTPTTNPGADPDAATPIHTPTPWCDPAGDVLRGASAAAGDRGVPRPRGRISDSHRCFLFALLHGSAAGENGHASLSCWGWCKSSPLTLLDGTAVDEEEYSSFFFSGLPHVLFPVKFSAVLLQLECRPYHVFPDSSRLSTLPFSRTCTISRSGLEGPGATECFQRCSTCCVPIASLHRGLLLFSPHSAVSITAMAFNCVSAVCASARTPTMSAVTC